MTREGRVLINPVTNREGTGGGQGATKRVAQPGHRVKVVIVPPARRDDDEDDDEDDDD